MNIKIENSETANVEGVSFRYIAKEEGFRDEMFSWFPADESIALKSTDVNIGKLTVETGEVAFKKVEYHDDTEIFCYHNKPVYICFCRLEKGIIKEETIKIVYVPENTIVTIAENIGHCVPISAVDEVAEAIVISGKSCNTNFQDFSTKIIGKF